MQGAAAAPPKRYVPDDMERRVIERWRRDGTFKQQVAAGRAAYDKDAKKRFVFLEGPPTANGLPHPGHVLTRTMKDSVCRYHAMLGKWVPRKAGWDCHGLPVEIEVQKELGIEHVDQVLAYGMEKFNEKCRQSVFRYKKDWEAMTERLGHWLDYDDPYTTMDDGFIESTWWSLKRMFDAGLLYKGYKVVPYCPQTGTSYSSHEVALGYKDVTDTSVFVKFHVEGDPDNARILSWTTTPWTLPGNVALAVGADIDYVKVKVVKASDKANAKEGEVFIVAKALQKKALRNESVVLAEMKGRDLIGKKYRPLFPGAVDPKSKAPWGTPQKAWVILPADFVTTEDGTGVVHTAVMYGEDDFQLGQKEKLPAQHTVGLDGLFVDRVKGLAGKQVKDAATEQAILAHLATHDLLYRKEEFEHSYPHCWRTGHPLLYYAMDSWYIQMSKLRDRLLENNVAINWVPDSIKDGRMGDWLRNVKDWACSRSRFWGTPIPVWTCGSCKHQLAVGSRKELEALGVKAKELHRPYVDQAVKCPTCGGKAEREPYVVDVWFDSGAAQFAQWKTTSGTEQELREQWPADYITEGLDQTRGWFYSLLAIATALGGSEAKAAPNSVRFQGPPYRNCVVTGLILAEDGQKMSKSKKNYVTPDRVFASQGADATRWYLLSTTAPWQDKRFYEEAVRETFGKFFGTLWNTFLFWHQYARLDKWTPAQAVPAEKWAPLDRWLHSRLQATVVEARFEADRYNLHKATRAIEAFVVDDLSNWWVRRSRDRFWRVDSADSRADSADDDKASAHSTLWTALHKVCRLVAPFAPFMVEHMWSHVRRPDDPASVHLANYPTPAPRNEALEREMAHVRALAEAGRALRSKVDIPSRHPLGRAVLIGGHLGTFASVLQEELNVKSLESAHDARLIKRFVAKPNRAKLGPSFKRLAPHVADAIEALDGDHAHKALSAGGSVGVMVEGQEHSILAEHVSFEEMDRDGWATTTVDGVTLALHIHRDESLLAEALAREVIRRIQETRKAMDLDVEAGIEVTLDCGPDAEARLQRFAGQISGEVRARKLDFARLTDAETWDIDGTLVRAKVHAVGAGRKAVEAA